MQHYATLCSMMIRIEPDLVSYIEELADTDHRSVNKTVNLLLRSRVYGRRTDPKPIAFIEGNKTTVSGHSIKAVQKLAEKITHSSDHSSECRNGHYTTRLDRHCMQKGCKYAI